MTLERLPEPLQAAAAEGDHVETRLQLGELRVRGQEGLRRPAQTAPFLLGHHLERVAVAPAGLGLDLAEDESPPAAEDEVELVPADPDVRAQDPVTAQAVMPPRPPLGGPAGRGGASE